ncbi:MAG: colanic acid biosynthesis glycosyltransferase WcaL, partial [Gemmatimonadaceae bacterium]|nr:colanic acid biosynthesis glycosyltransferase WcaL [Gloeobacterales cyanobacterium ES-bin-141]
PEVWPGMGRAGRLRVEQEYDINKLNDHLFDVYRQLSGWEPSQPVVYRGA